MPAPSVNYKVHLRTQLLSALFDPVFRMHDDDLDKILVRNTVKQGYFHYSFAFNGKFYSMDGEEGPKVRQKLHDDLVPTMREYLKEYGHELDMEKAKVAAYITSMTAFTPCPGDYLLLLPEALRAVVQASLETIDWSSSLSPEKITEFVTKYQSGYDTIRQRLALNLLL